MRAAQLVELNRIEIIDIPLPEPQNDTDVQVRVKTVGICGTDLHIFRQPRADVALPRIMGHELAGIVTKTGKAVSKVKLGDRVVLDPVFACGQCRACHKGYNNVCENVKCFGVQMDGGYQDYIVVGEEHLYAFDPSVSYDTAALAEPFSIAANILGRVQASDADNILIIGGGTIGLSLLQVAKSKGARVMVADIAQGKLVIAKEMGADAVVNSKERSLAQEAQAFSPGGFDVVIDAVGVSELFQQSLEYAAPRARVACIGFDARPAQIPPVVVTKKELSIIGSRMNCHQFTTVVKWLNEGKLQADAMISKRYPIERIQNAFEDTLRDAENIKTLIAFD